MHNVLYNTFILHFNFKLASDGTSILKHYNECIFHQETNQLYTSKFVFNHFKLFSRSISKSLEVLV